MIKKIISNPSYYFSTLLAILRGTYYIFYFYLFNRNVKIGFPFLVSSRVIIKGPGHVEIGKRCVVVENVFKGLTIITSSPDSAIKIGNRCMLAGLTIRCSGHISIGDNVMTAVSLIQDSYFVNRDEALLKQHVDKVDILPINLGSNVWIGGHCIVLGGSHIGPDSVMSAYSLCFNETIKEFSLLSGNPVRKALPIEQLLKLRNVS